MKHIEITYYVGSHGFTYVCSTVFEAISALDDIFSYDCDSFFDDVDRDEYIKDLVNIRYGSTIKIENKRLIIRCVDGEV